MLSPVWGVFFFSQAVLLGPSTTVFHRSMCMVKVSYGKFPFVIIILLFLLWSKLTHLDFYFFFFRFVFGPLWLAEFLTEGEEQVGLKSCQSCVSALRHSQNVFFVFVLFFSRGGVGGGVGWGGTGRHDCRSILLPCLPVLAILNKNGKPNVACISSLHPMLVKPQGEVEMLPETRSGLPR